MHEGKNLSFSDFKENESLFENLSLYKTYKDLDKNCTCERNCSYEDSLLSAELEDNNYWLYDKLITSGFGEDKIKSIFNFFTKHIYGDILEHLLGSDCPFHILSFDEIEKLKKIYSFSEIYYEIDSKNKDVISKGKNCNYFKDGINLYNKAKISCSRNRSAYCKEFIEYKKIHKGCIYNSSILQCENELGNTEYIEANSLSVKSLGEETSGSDEFLTQLSEVKKSNYFVDPVLSVLLKNDKKLEESRLHRFYKKLEESKEKQNDCPCNSIEGYSGDEKNSIGNLCEDVCNILGNWIEKYKDYDKLPPKKTCAYFKHWLYGKLNDIEASPCDIDLFYNVWKNIVDKNHKNTTCYSMKYYGFSKHQLAYKKKLFDFLEHYDTIRDKIKDNKNKYKNYYCDYVMSNFQLFKIMQRESVSQIYGEEVDYFISKFAYNIKELSFLNNKCPGRCLNLVFDENNTKLCPFEEPPKEADQKKADLCNNTQTVTAQRSAIRINDKEYNFENLTTYKIYKTLDEEVTTNRYLNDCSILLPSTKEQCKIYGLCTKLARNLEKLTEINKKEQNDRCAYISYWIYDQLYNIFGANKTNINDIPDVKKLLNVGYNVLYKLGIHDCYYDMHRTNIHDYNEKKYLHDYFKNYEAILPDTLNENEKANKYCAYLTYINELYGKYIGDCCIHYSENHYWEECKDHFKCDQTFNPHTLYSKLKCDNKLPFKRFRKITPINIDYYVKLLTEKSKENPKLVKMDKEDPSTSLQITDKESASGSASASASASDSASGSASDYFSFITIVSFAILGIFMMFFILYKFTPLSSWIHKNKQKEKNFHYNDYEEQMQELMDRESQYDNAGRNGGRVRLAYHVT
ncbi:PIR Superfamily Protein [Plasmodium ovale wallikeri]|uniref:PIR Superfamily Protein n=1 Tax=Plasmodium ovale wallikeri TaxID=864142 RepID=A0A1A9APX8_PLAOA|nr:PIR Superfamily Protein [Plasmodium ovale wallikeri]SBT58248.1 PIR Superfamily Protein [Plasmodium ovale wallikeri]